MTGFVFKSDSQRFSSRLIRICFYGQLDNNIFRETWCIKKVLRIDN